MPTPRGVCGSPSACDYRQTDGVSPQRKPSNKFWNEKPVDVRLEQLKASVEKQDVWLKEHVAALEVTVGSVAARLDRLLDINASGKAPDANVLDYSVGSASVGNAAVREKLRRLNQDVSQLASMLDQGAQQSGVQEPSAQEPKERKSNVSMASAGSDAPPENIAHLTRFKDQFQRLERKAGKQGDIPASDLARMLQQLSPSTAPKLEEVEFMLKRMHAEMGEKDAARAVVMDLKVFIQLMEEPPFDVIPLREAFVLEAEREQSILDAKKPAAKSRFNGATSFYLDIIPASVLMLNALVIGVSSDVAPESTAWQVLEILFTIFFTGEIVLKGYLFGMQWLFCGEDRTWNWFDIACMSIAYVDMIMTYLIFSPPGAAKTEEQESGSFMLLKMLRLARLSRLIRLLRFKIFNELKMMVLGVFTGIRVLFWAIVLLISIVYVLGVVTRKMIGPAQDEFNTVTSSMFTIFRCFVDGCSAYNGTPLQERLRSDYGEMFTILYTLVFLFVTFGLFNLIMAIFIDNVVSAQAEKKRKEMGDNTELIRDNIKHVVGKLAASSGGHGHEHGQRFTHAVSKYEVSREVFETWLEDAEMMALLEDAGIETSSKHEIYDVLDVDMNGRLRFIEIVDGLMKLRGDVTKADIVAVRMKVRYITSLLEECAHSLKTQRNSEKW